MSARKSTVLLSGKAEGVEVCPRCKLDVTEEYGMYCPRCWTVLRPGGFVFWKEAA
jgi:hypothetical protein